MSEPITIEEDLSFSVSFSNQISPSISREMGFNEYGVKSYDDGSIDVTFAAMEPGLRKGFRVTDEFLARVASNFTDGIPMQLDHSPGQLANVGKIKEVKFSDGYLRLLGHVPNTGNSVRNDVIADFSYTPPAITDGSVGFGQDYVIERNGSGELEFVDATLSEFSLTPFPAGYETGGLSPAFTSAARDAGLVDIDSHDSEKDESFSAGTSRLRGTSRARIYTLD